MKKMNRFLTVIFSVMMIAALASCDKNNDTPSASKTYKMLYRAAIPVSAFEFGNPTVTIYNPSSKQTETINLTLDKDNHNEADFVNDYKTICAMMSLSAIDPNDFFFYYYQVPNITKDMTYEATLKLNIDETKSAALDPTAKTKFGVPSMGVAFYNITDSKTSSLSLSLSMLTNTNAKALEFYSKPTCAEKTISGTVVLP